MRFGIFLLAGRFPGQTDAEALRRAADAVVTAERAGFDDAWIAEHHFMSYGVCPSAITFAATLLGRTERITLGTAVSVLSTTHPVALAEQVALLDNLSGGRVHLGVGRGGPWVDLEVFGTGIARYERDFAESLDLLLRALTDERISADGPAFRFREVPMVPRPHTVPHPPVTVACTSQSTVDIAAARGLPMLLGMQLDDEEKAAMVRRYAARAAEAGHDPAAVPHVSAVLAHVADSADEARAQLLGAMPGWLRTGLAGYVTVDGRPRTMRDPHEYAEQLCSLHPVGTADECAAALLDSAERTGIRHVIAMVEGTGDHALTKRTIERLGSAISSRATRGSG
ncbi:alkanesulfonate monooxygenase SsuD/methylene tetrahydromethanopterin reductase-like flavin-dependent oxidoreductase (luciferase family) [Herbihabitans rhizosphaerae]|uniref:Alkanesulfonate monooxygenase SsuD/methylene tetrahydromethanopterin reductase-like flavin-dependent oxidoreductase (Luciferase family) n=1 Tax=Herbihabitans rhizosphaerae TaxID=1872711 RepID=A0A4Q7KPT9_9PSEU|nr:LLM class flavin-dependent oxidoreductase [Herbihabitans rhizosphaerae]RZS38818.1 alkanesulfonate monooxygenase SsuD/methylene tetrahydromethanopterin reductase-like flavin-dependent oxidoreductase (luciferase family) [Herbihabitans rhizosphaerae]